MSAEPLASSPLGPVDPAAEPPGSGERGSVEQRYESLFLIGRGGMGTVEVALERGEGGFERIVALKRMLPETSGNARHKEMFLREARLAALLDHPNVVHAFSFGELRGEFFLAMEYVEGEPLSKMLQAAREKEGGLVPALAAHVLAEICDGLHAAHELTGTRGNPLNVVHRDVSPHNVMISYDGHVKLLDFGVAKFDAGQAMTRTGEVKGKMGYMSPEQALGEPHDRRSDLWSIGAVLYECITGRRMWGDGTDLEVMRKLALEEPPRLDLHPNAPKPLAELHARLVARSPDDRPPTARAVADELRAYVATSGTRPDARVVRAVMTRLFELEADRQRAALSQALERVAPSHVDELRRSLEPRAPDASPSPMIERETAPASRSTKQADGVVVTSTEARPGRRGLVAVVGIALVVAVAIGAVALLGRGDRVPSSSSSLTTSTSTATATATSAATATATSTTTATATATSTATVRASATGPARPLPPPPATTIANLPPAPPPPTPSTKPTASATATVKPPPDVDPTPF